MTHPHLKGNFVPKAVLMKYGIKTLNTAGQNFSKAAVSVNTARPINTAYPRPIVNSARTVSNVFNIAHSHVFTSNKNSNLNEKVNTVKGNVTTAGPKAVVSDNKRNKANAVKASACWGHPQLELQEKGVIDRDPKGGKISIGKLDFEDVYFFKELKFNLFSVSQICDKKNSILFTYNECVVLSLDFKLLDENHVLLRVPRKDNMYSVDLKNIVPSGGLTCLFAKATLDESNLWHRWLGHINLKTKNKLVRGNLVRGLPSKIFENNHTCVACQSGKQHKASCKTKIVSSISQPLQMLHMDLFGPTFVKSLMKKVYCLVVTDDYSRFSWVFFLATTDETSEILKTFITGVENLIDLKVKVIRCDNGTEFKNKVMNQFCEMKGIKREFSVARTSQQNGVVERKNRTLIEAANTMLGDSKLPTTFWAKAVNIVCYVQNRVLVIKPHNKTPYELFQGRKPALSFMRPFGCTVTILNTIDHLGKFDGKADGGFFVGYSTNSKAFRVFNSRTRIVEENLHVKFSEDTPNILRSGPNWIFDIDALTKFMNYELVVAVNQSNGSVGTKACNDAGKAIMKTIPSKDYIPLPFLTQDLSFSSSSKNSPYAGFKPSGEEEKKDAKDPENKDKNNAANENIVYGCDDDPNMPNLEEIVYSDDDEEVDAKADMTNLDTYILGYTQEEGIDYDEVFAPVARIEAIRLFLAYASFKDFVVYQMDVKSAFLYGKIDEEVYVCQPPGFEDPEFPDKVYKVEKALYGLHQAPRAWYETLSTYLLDNGFQRGQIDKTLFIKRVKGDILLVQVYVDDIIFGSTKKGLCTEFEKLMHKKFQMSTMGELTFFLGLQVTQKDDGIFISQDKYVDEILKEFGFLTVKTASAPMETLKPLLKDAKVEDVDVHLYRSMIGSLMYLTASRPDIMFFVCACARFQVTPKVSHLHAIKRIFRYLKGQPKLGLWYTKDSPFDLEAYIDSDYAGASLDRKSTIGGCQFIRRRLISWQCKKQTIVANSTTKEEYVAASSCCGQVLWIQNQMLDYGYNFMNNKIFIDNESTICIVKNPVFHSKTKHIEIMHHFIRDSYEKRLIQVIKIHTDHNVADLLTKAFDVSRFQYLIASSGLRCQDTILRGAEAQIRFEAVSKRSNNPPLSRVNTLRSGEDNMKLKELMEFCTKLSERALDLYALMVNPTIYTSCIKQLWATAKVSAYTSLSRWEEELERMGSKTTAWNEFGSTMASAIFFFTTNQIFNFSKYIFDNMVKNLKGGDKFLMYP
ncbi:putative ribonuclease H-like domain-containing protein, partial [Tanacetum coccineum]